MYELTNKISKLNYNWFIWHAAFLALASSFMDVDIIMPAILGEAGGNAFQMGILVMILMGGSSFSQIIFAPYLHNKNFKKKFLLIGINLRIVALACFAILFFYFNDLFDSLKIWAILLLASLFAFSGAFANISYVDILGKSIKKTKRKSFLSLKQIISASGLFVSAIIARKIIAFYDVPLSYEILFLFAAVFLTIASLGFWKIKEVPNKVAYIHSLMQFMQFMKKEIKENKKLRRYLLVINTLGVSLSLMPFLILYGKENLATAGIFLGNLLFIKITGGVLMSSFLFYFSKRFKYTHILYTTVFLSISMLILTFFSPIIPALFYFSFFFGGIMIATYSITINGILLEITHNENRAMYTGLAGAGNIIPALFPLLGGMIIKTSGFTFFFLVVAVIIFCSTIFIKKLNCMH